MSKCTWMRASNVNQVTCFEHRTILAFTFFFFFNYASYNRWIYLGKNVSGRIIQKIVQWCEYQNGHEHKFQCVGFLQALETRRVYAIIAQCFFLEILIFIQIALFAEMKFAVVLCLAFAFVAVRAKETTYTDRFDSIDVDQILRNERLLKPYLNCLLKEGSPCTADARELKSNENKVSCSDFGEL